MKMLKWIGRILYVVFIFIIISTVELGSGGVQGLQRGDYAVAHVVSAKDDDGNYDPHKALAHFTSAINIYYSNQVIGSSLLLEMQPLMISMKLVLNYIPLFH